MKSAPVDEGVSRTTMTDILPINAANLKHVHIPEQRGARNCTALYRRCLIVQGGYAFGI